ncbi:MAG: hypothetical protein ACTTGJ_02965 [Clostridium sp.]
MLTEKLFMSGPDPNEEYDSECKEWGVTPLDRVTDADLWEDVDDDAVDVGNYINDR